MLVIDDRPFLEQGCICIVKGLCGMRQFFKLIA
jgi:hypothetical protein